MKKPTKSGKSTTFPILMALGRAAESSFVTNSLLVPVSVGINGDDVVPELGSLVIVSVGNVVGVVVGINVVGDVVTGASVIGDVVTGASVIDDDVTGESVIIDDDMGASVIDDAVEGAGVVIALPSSLSSSFMSILLSTTYSLSLVLSIILPSSSRKFTMRIGDL